LCFGPAYFLDASVRTTSLLTAALGAGFYRYWHVPSPDATVDVRAARRADLSVIGPGALAVLAAGTWLTGRVGASLLMDERVVAPLESLPWTARLLTLAGVLGLALALLWWLATAPLRASIARGVATGSVVRLPDDPAEAGASLHAAATLLGRTLRQQPEPRPLTEPAFEVLRTAGWVLTGDADPESPTERRLRRRCLSLARRLESTSAPVRPHVRNAREHAAA
jgi:hypothetical protein